MLVSDKSELIVAPVRTFNARVRAYNGSTLVYNFTHNDAVQAITITRAAEQNKFFGFGICQKTNVKLRDVERAINISTEHELVINIEQDGSNLSIYPNFKVTEVHRNEKTNQLSITAYDALYFATWRTVSELGLESYTIREFATACANLLGISSVNIPEDLTVFDTVYENGANFDGTETIREALDAVAEATQTIYYIDNTQSLRFRKLTTEKVDYTISKDMYIDLNSGDNRRLSKIYHTTELGDDVFAELAETGTTQYVRDNPFWNLREDIGTIVDNALAAIGGLTINQFECEWRGNYLVELGDCIGLVTKDNNTVYSFLLNDTIEYDGSYKQKSLWQYDEEEFDTAKNPSSLGEVLKKTYAKVDKINKQIDIVASESNANSEAISILQLNTDSISASVTKVEQTTADALKNINEEIATITSKVNSTITEEELNIIISSALENGVNKVETSTGFTFNEEGLMVSKSDSEMKTSITEDGMTVYKNDEAVLIANNTGVNAVNLHATTYLIIGTNSRFEDFGDKRTGCFFIG